MKRVKIVALLLALTGITTACGQKGYEDAEVEEFARLVEDSTVMVLDVRTLEEYGAGHLKRAINIDVKQEGFASTAEFMLPKECTIAVYCRSGRRSAHAAELLAEKGYKAVNLKGGILSWEKAGKAVER
jgi:rhodanese-related sulfurtransferase